MPLASRFISSHPGALYGKVSAYSESRWMKVIRAEAMGMCFGVRDALAAAKHLYHPERVTIHGELVHNELVHHQLLWRGFRITAENQRDQLPATTAVLITAHGISDAERRWLAEAGKELIDTTCPLVTRVHQAARKLANEGRHIIVIGKPGHVEVRGIVEDLPSYDVVSNVGDVHCYDVPHIGIICQSTTPPRVAEQVRQAIVQLNPQAEVRSIDTICQPTRDRQAAVDRMLSQVQAVVVVGGRNSNNTRELAALCQERGLPTWHVQGPDDIRPEWFAGFATVGLTAGTSTLDETISAVEEALVALNGSEKSQPASPFPT